ncbi:CidA/LrgA family holin-like protein [Paenibacillus protaetiae]|uniref:CidA/LrgA family holin-like protein n=1 Tax=Paenibacillus protaetiae TaxID=2509456 RepID=A0A4P6EYF4_9BACL|nr:CidA/LrgA family holin-like protein [Paenibacillus protaetiae]
MRLLTLTVLQVAAIFILSKIADAIVLWLHLPVPGSIVGIGLLFALLKLRIIRLSWIDLGAKWLIAEMLLFFIPSTVGIVNYESLIQTSGLRLAFIIVASTMAVMLCTGFAAQWISRKRPVTDPEGKKA